MDFQELLDFAKKTRWQIVERFYEGGKGLNSVIEILGHNAKLAEEVGELSSEVMNNLSYQRQAKMDKSRQENLAEEAADVIIVVLIMAEAMEVDISQALKNKMQKIDKRKFD